MELKDIILRETEYSFLTTKGSELTKTEFDNNIVLIFQTLMDMLRISGHAVYSATTNYPANVSVLEGDYLYLSLVDDNYGHTPGAKGSETYWVECDISQIMTANDYHVILLADFIALKTNGQLINGKTYYIVNPDAIKEGEIIEGNQVLQVMALGSNKVSKNAKYKFYNCDYQLAGSYTLVTDLATKLGIWTAAKGSSSVTGDVCIWNGYHWHKKTNNATTTEPQSDAANWEYLPKITGNGYISEWDEIIINFDEYDDPTAFFLNRKDKRGNNISEPYNFAFGNDNVTGNTFLPGHNSLTYNFIGTMVDCVINQDVSTDFDNADSNDYEGIIFISKEITSTVGNVTINKLSGSAIIANGAQKVTVTNDKVKSNSIVVAISSNNAYPVLSVEIIDGSFNIYSNTVSGDITYYWHVIN